MLSSEAFLRNLYIGIDLSERMRVEAMVTSHDIVETAYNQLCDILQRFAADHQAKPTPEERVQCAMACWTIIDNLHMFRQLSKALLFMGTELSVFSESIADVTIMRNSMDHLHGNLSNAGRKKSPTHPLYGFISFFAACEDGGCDCINFPLGQLNPQKMYSPIIDTQASRPVEGLDHVNFAAFNKQINISKVIIDLQATMLCLNRYFHDKILDGIKSNFHLIGISPEEEIKKALNGNFVFRLKLQ